MTFLPIVERELRGRARQRSTYRFRLVAAVIASALTAVLIGWSETFVTPATFGAWVFRALAWATFLYCLLEGTRHTADCLSEEKRAGTLGLLFLTDLRAYDVVLGKLLAASLTSFYSLLAVFPPLAIPLILGGVTAGEFWRLALVLVNTLFFSAAMGMLVSALSREERRAWAATTGIMALFALALPVVARVARGLAAVPLLGAPTWIADLCESVAVLSPSTAFVHGFDAAHTTAPENYWFSLLLTHVLGWAFLVAACYVLPRAWQDAPVRPRDPWLRRLARRLVGRDEETRLRERHRLLAENPALFLAARSEEQQALLWLFVVGTGATGAMLAVAFGPGAATWVLSLCGLAVHFLLAVWVASQACFQFADARDSGALELLLTTPLSAARIVEGHVLALKRMFFKPVVTLLSLEVAVYLAVMIAGGPANPGLLSFSFTQFAVAIMLVIAVLDLYAVGYFGLWMGLTTKKPTLALTKTVLYVLVLPMFAGVCCVLWPLAGVVKNLIFINYGRDKLNREFRRVVMERFLHGAEEAATLPPPKRDRGRLPPVIEA